MLAAIRNLIRTLILPNNAGPNDPAIIIGPDLPPCMQAQYQSALFFRPDGTASGGIGGKAWMFIGLNKFSLTTNVDIGWLVYDQGGGVCGYVVGRTFAGPKAGGTGQINPTEIVAALSQVGSASFLVGNSVQYGGAPGVPGVPTIIDYGSAGLTPTLTVVRMDGISIGRGLAAVVASQANSAAIGAEAIALTLPTMTFWSGRAYRVDVDAPLLGSVANVALYRIRRTNLAGAILASWQHPVPTGGGGQHRFSDRIYITRNSASSDLTDNLVITLTASAGTVTQIGANLEVRSAMVYDIGAFGDYSSFKQI